MMKTSEKNYSNDKKNIEIYNFKCHDCGKQITATYEKSEEDSACEFCDNEFFSPDRDDH